MNRKSIIGITAAALIAVLALVIVPAFAQDGTGTVVASTTDRVITVSGIGQAYGDPDIAYVEVGVMEADADVSAAFTRTNEKVEAVRQALLAAGIAEADLQTTNINMYANQGYDPQTGTPTENVTYQVVNTIRVTVRDISTVSAVITAAVDAGANQIYGLSFGIADTTALEQQAREAAVANARARADELAGLVSVTVGEVVVISESYGNMGVPPVAYNMAEMGRGGGGGAPVETGRMMVQVQVNITYASPTCEPTYFGYTETIDLCGDEGGWYYDDNDPPQAIQLCPTSCDKVSVPGGKLVFTVGCDTRIVPR